MGDAPQEISVAFSIDDCGKKQNNSASNNTAIFELRRLIENSNADHELEDTDENFKVVELHGLLEGVPGMAVDSPGCPDRPSISFLGY